MKQHLVRRRLSSLSQSVILVYSSSFETKQHLSHEILGNSILL